MPILLLDFDGVMHSYTSGWQGVDACPDPPVPGLEAFLQQAVQRFEVHVFSSRSADDAGLLAMRMWCYAWLPKPLADCLHFPREKPPAMVTLDDRAITFTGTWPDVQMLLAFQPWTRHTSPPHEHPQPPAEPPPMPRPTPGQIAYDAYHHGAPLPWTLLPAYERQNWEAAAQAVRAMQEQP